AAGSGGAQEGRHPCVGPGAWTGARLQLRPGKPVGGWCPCPGRRQPRPPQPGAEQSPQPDPGRALAERLLKGLAPFTPRGSSRWAVGASERVVRQAAWEEAVGSWPFLVLPRGFPDGAKRPLSCPPIPTATLRPNNQASTCSPGWGPIAARATSSTGLAH